MNYSPQHDELATLFGTHLNLSPHSLPPPQSTSQPEPSPQKTNPIHYVSTHYTPTAHISTSPPPPYSEHDLIQTLLAHAIDPSTLTPSQLQLFAHAQPEQRQRLVELWNISSSCPPTYTHNSDPISPIRGPGESPWPPAARMRIASITAATRRSAEKKENAPAHTPLD